MRADGARREAARQLPVRTQSLLGSSCVLPRSPPHNKATAKAYGWKLGAPQLQRQTSGTVSYMRAVVQQCIPVRSNGLAQRSQQSLCVPTVAALTEHLAAADERITCV